MVLPDPNTSGKDLYNRTRTIIVQTRFLVHTNFLSESRVRSTLESQLGALTHKLEQDFQYNAAAERGYAILSYVSMNFTNTLVFEVLR